jgi:hypothetical protein
VILANAKDVPIGPGNVHQILGEPSYVGDLPIDHVKRPKHLRSVRRRPADELSGELQRGERCAKLMRHHSQNLIFQFRCIGMVADWTGRIECDDGRLSRSAFDNFISPIRVAFVASANRPPERCRVN